MKILKINLIAALVFLSLTTCSTEDLNEGDVLTTLEAQNTIYNDGDIEQR